MRLLPILLLFSLTACGQQPPAETSGPTTHLTPNVKPTTLLHDFRTWWTYHNAHVTLSDDFVPLDTARQEIGKGDFLQALTTGDYIPLRLVAGGNRAHLQLYPLPAEALGDIGSAMVNVGKEAHKQFSMEGTAFPDFAVTTLDGATVDNASARGKTLIIKSWFVRCGACIKEMPELNALVAEYADRDDVAFLSMAYDDEPALRKFMTKRAFDYPTASVDRAWLESELRVYNYPTHFVVDKDGIIRKVVNSVEELKKAMAKWV